MHRRLADVLEQGMGFGSGSFWESTPGLSLAISLEPCPMTNPWASLSQLGDSRLLLPIAASLIAIGLWRGNPWARRWALAMGAIGLIVFASKLAFLGWGLGIPRLNFTGFSGHAAMSALVWPVVFWLLMNDRVAGRSGALFGLLLALSIAYSRLPLNVHSLSEVISGFALGAAGSLSALSGGPPIPRLQRRCVIAAIVLGSCVPAVIPQVHTHQMVVAAAKALSGRVTVFDRSMQR